jgi:UDP-glucose:glycoprotein glucosyltransferase
MLRLSQLPWGLAMALMASLATASPAVNVGMNAAFPRGPYLLELLYAKHPDHTTLCRSTNRL